MNSITFVGWVGDDALRVLKTHVPIALNGVDNSKDFSTMQKYVEKMKEQIRSSKFKSLNIKAIEGTYILHLGKCIDNVSLNGVSIKEIPNKLVEDSIHYISLIKDGKIGRTKYPTIYNMMFGQTSKNTKEDDDSLDRTEAVNNIIRRKPVKEQKLEKLEKLEKPEIPEPEEIPENPENSGNAKSSKIKEKPETSKETEDIKITDRLPKNQSKQDDDIEYSNVEVHTSKKSVKFDEDEQEELPESPKEPVKEQQKEQPKGKANSDAPISRKQRRKQMIDDAEESRWENF